ncbi:T-complex 1 subunit gamma [Olea europaea subsp. europaea]|uniref:T-complex 1 subunit gamma n=1 Tax=Olea europaea subsp. europaea TaxID=158383 RepID=A0A8S0SU66_OLEEU|nr:T-complex 1 subunit gamma [Olea europaea subsp. europaea]
MPQLLPANDGTKSAVKFFCKEVPSMTGCNVSSKKHNKNPKLVPGGGATELTVSAMLKQRNSSIEGREKHANGKNEWIGIDGNTGEIAKMKERKIWDSYTVKAQAFKTATEAACMLLRIDDIVSGIKKKQAPGASQGPSKPKIKEEGDVDNEEMIPE